MNGKVLVVDDEAEIGFMLSNLLRHHGYDTIAAETVDVALNFADDVPIAAIVLDANIAGEDGLKLLSFLRQNHPGVPVIIYTGMDHEPSVVEKILKEGAVQYLRKGRPLDELLRAVESVVK
jgi:DNA-binding response OmpR family regulator